MKSFAALKFCLTLFISLSFASAGYASDKRVRMFFGLSFPNGSGVSLQQWQEWEDTVLAEQLTGFNVVDSTGYYKGQPERSKVVTVIVFEGDKETMNKIKAIAIDYAKRFGQESVLVVTTEAEATFITQPAD